MVSDISGVYVLEVNTPKLLVEEELKQNCNNFTCIFISVLILVFFFNCISISKFIYA